MDIPLDEVVYFDAISSSSTGAAADADSTPTFAVYEEATDTDIGVGGNMTKRTSLTGNYRGSFTASAANGFELGKWYNVIGSATIGAIATKGVLMRFRIVAAEVVAGYPAADTLKVGGTTQTAGDLKTLIDAVDNFVDTEIADIQSRLPAALVSGRMDASVGAMAANVLTASAIANGAITINKFDNSAKRGLSGVVLGALASVTSQTSMALSGGPSDNNALVGWSVVFYDSILDPGYTNPSSVGVVSAYTGATGAFTLAAASNRTISTNDVPYFFPPDKAAIQPVTLGRTLVVDSDGLADANAVKVGPTGSGTVQTGIDLGGTIPDSIPADGSRPTSQQALYMLVQGLFEKAIVGTTYTVYKPDGTTPLFTLTLNSATTPTASTRAT